MLGAKYGRGAHVCRLETSLIVRARLVAVAFISGGGAVLFLDRRLALGGRIPGFGFRARFLFLALDGLVIGIFGARLHATGDKADRPRQGLAHVVLLSASSRTAQQRP